VYSGHKLAQEIGTKARLQPYRRDTPIVDAVKDFDMRTAAE
jgi:dimethylamine/trimethylamine dehydrogenase